MGRKASRRLVTPLSHLVAGDGSMPRGRVIAAASRSLGGKSPQVGGRRRPRAGSGRIRCQGLHPRLEPSDPRPEGLEKGAEVNGSRGGRGGVPRRVG